MLSYDEAHDLVNKVPNLSWDGWSIMEHREDSSAEMHKNGKFVNGKWCFVKYYHPTDKGWEVPKKYARS